jgi:hypothetical protein
MTKPRHDRSKGQSDYGDHDGNEPEFDDPEQHREIEKRRFRGGLPATPEMYARAREQWYRLPGSLVRPSMDPVIGDPAPGEQPPGPAGAGGKQGGS